MSSGANQPCLKSIVPTSYCTYIYIPQWKAVLESPRELLIFIRPCGLAIMCGFIWSTALMAWMPAADWSHMVVGGTSVIEVLGLYCLGHSKNKLDQYTTFSFSFKNMINNLSIYHPALECGFSLFPKCGTKQSNAISHICGCCLYFL